jgi:hypothetical protein
MLRMRNSSGSPALLRSTRIKMRAVASIFHTARRRKAATHTAHLLIPKGIAGVGTFPSWLGLRRLPRRLRAFPSAGLDEWHKV